MDRLDAIPYIGSVALHGRASQGGERELKAGPRRLPLDRRRPGPAGRLVRGHQWCSGGAGDDPDDASYRQRKGHGPIYGDWYAPF